MSSINCQTNSGQSLQCHSGCQCHCCRPCDSGFIEWVPTTNKTAGELCERAVVGGHMNDCSPMWVIRARFEGDMVPGKFAVKLQEAYVPWGNKEHRMENIEVCCAPSEKIEWIECRDGNVPPRAVKGGWTAAGETMYIGRKHHNGALTPGKIHPPSKLFYMPYGGQELRFSDYEVMCTV